MYTELNMWDQATLIAQDDGGGSTDILRKKAKMLLNRNELMAAANVYMQIGEYAVAIDIFGPNGWLDNLIEVARKLKKSETKALSRCVYFFRSQNHHTYAAEVLIKMGDIQHLLNLHLDLGHWEDAFKISETHPQFAQQIYLPYANWLAMNDQFVEAQLNYKMAGRLDVAFRVLGQLANNSISEKRFYITWL
jgi:intraflagellar transport protein 122